MDRRRILIVDDSPLNRELLVQLLEGRCEIIQAENGADAIEVAVRTLPDLILMDLSLPILSGWDAIAALRRGASTRAIPIVAVSARTMAHEIARARDVGADDFVPLPLNERRLFSVVSRHLRLSPTVFAAAAA